MNIELRHLRYFVAVAEELHFGRAAARLNISQPPLSQQIQALEQQIGARLLARTNRSVLLTAAGKQFLADSRQILSMVDDAAARAERLHQGEAGELRIGFTSSAPFIRAVSDTLSLFRRDYPDVHLQTREMNTREQIAPLIEGTLDMGLLRNTALPESLEHAVIVHEPLMAMIPHDHPLANNPSVTLAELAKEPFVFFDPHVGTGLYDDILSNILGPNEDGGSTGKKKEIYVTGRATLMNLISQTDFYSIGIHDFDKQLSDFRAVSVPIPGCEVKLEFGYVTLADVPISGIGEEFLKEVRERLERGQDA